MTVGAMTVAVVETSDVVEMTILAFHYYFTNIRKW